MCGISGIILKSKTNIDVKQEITSMSRTLQHRGPDGEGFFSLSVNGAADTFFSSDTTADVKEASYLFSAKKNISELNQQDCKLVFNHRRLAIIDVHASGHQPMCDTTSDYWITYNGEIYNYVELKNELTILGHTFITESDTEVILEAYKEWGYDCVNKFNGMWAFVLLDKKQNKLFGSRDRFGVKPFYYYNDSSVFCFASEQKALVRSAFVKTNIRNEAVFDYFVLDQLEYEEEGMFANIFELFPAQNFVFDLQNNEFKKWTYYSLPVQQEVSYDVSEAVEKFRELFFKSIELRLRSDVKVGSCLSGGLDSSSIVAVMNNLNKTANPLELFTASYTDANIDESNFAKQIIESTNSNWHQVFPNSQELQRDFSDLVYSLDVPIWSTSTFAQYSVMRLANQNKIKVLLDGQGGDELLGGYPHHYYYYWNELLKRKKLSQLNNEMANAPYNLANRAGFVRFKIAGNLKKITTAAENYYLKKNQTNKIISLDFLQTYKHRIANNIEISNEKSLNDRLKKEFINTNLKTYLRCEDRCSMRFSVESRTPFADDLPLIEFLFSLKAGLKINKGTNKYILRNALRDLLPTAIVNRKDKKGYLTPHTNWLLEQRFFFTNEINAVKTDFFNKNVLVEQYSNSLKQSNEANLFKYIVFSNWSKQYFVK